MKIRRRELIRQVSLRFRESLSPKAPMPKTVMQGSRQTVAHYELSSQAINEFINIVGDALSENREVVLRGFGRLVPRQYKPMEVRLPGALSGDDDVVFSVPVRLGVQFRPSPKLKNAIREHDKTEK